MSKISTALKALIDAPHARSGMLPAPKNITFIFDNIRRQAEAHKVSRPLWIAMATAATMTMDSPDSMTAIHSLVSQGSNGDAKSAVMYAELMREVGLKCIGFNGVPRTINCLGRFRDTLPKTVQKHLSTTPTRLPLPSNIEARQKAGKELWNSIYHPYSDKLLQKLSHSHSDLPVHILNAEYSLLFSDPARPRHIPGQSVGRSATSLVAVACLRAQTGVGPQVLSHLYGLRKALKDGTWKRGWEIEDSEDHVSTDDLEGVKWLASDEGGEWVLRSVDSIVEAIGEGQGGSFAPIKARL